MINIKKAGRFLIILLLLAAAALPARAVDAIELTQLIKSETAVLVDGDTGQVLFDKDMHLKMRPASITKIMTGLLALENGDLSDTITMSHDAVFSIGRGTSHIALDADEQLTLEQAMYALSIVSANDAANGIAEHIGGTLDNFATLMNIKAREAGAINTNFANAHGLSDDNHYTTAYDMARITMAALKEPEFKIIFGAEKYEMPPTNKQTEPRTFWSKNAMIAGKYKYDGIVAGKTGWTTDSQHTLVTIAERDGRTLIAVVMKSASPNDKWEDATALLDYGFDEFEKISFTAEELSIDDYTLTDGSGNDISVSVYTESGFSCLVPKPLSKGDIDVKYISESGYNNRNPQIKTVFSLKTGNEELSFPELGELEMTAALNVNSSDEMSEGGGAADELMDGQPGDDSGLNVVFIGLLAVAGAIIALFVFLYVRRYIYIQRRRRRRRHLRGKHAR